MTPATLLALRHLKPSLRVTLREEDCLIVQQAGRGNPLTRFAGACADWFSERTQIDKDLEARETICCLHKLLSREVDERYASDAIDGYNTVAKTRYNICNPMLRNRRHFTTHALPDVTAAHLQSALMKADSCLEERRQNLQSQMRQLLKDLMVQPPLLTEELHLQIALKTRGLRDDMPLADMKSEVEVLITSLMKKPEQARAMSLRQNLASERARLYLEALARDESDWPLLCSFMDVVVQLTTRDFTFSENTQNNLQRSLLAAWRQLHPDSREAVLAYLRNSDSVLWFAMTALEDCAGQLSDRHQSLRNLLMLFSNLPEYLADLFGCGALEIKHARQKACQHKPRQANALEAEGQRLQSALSTVRELWA